MFIYNLVVVVLAGMCFGSFISMASYRLSLLENSSSISIRESILKRSFCPNCLNTLKIKHLFPIFSWLFYRGKCGFCSKRISIRYPLIEIFNTVLFLTIFFALDSKFDTKLMLILLISSALMIMIIVDLENYFIPNIIQIILFFLVLVFHFIVVSKHNLLYYLFSALVFFVLGMALHYIFLFFTKKQGIGEDDLKFLPIAGFFLGIDQLIIFMMVSGIMGIIFGLLWTKIKQDETFPFAPSLAVAFLIPALHKIDYIEYMGTMLYWFEKYVIKTSIC